MTGFTPRTGDIAKATMQHEGRITRTRVDFGGGIHICAVYFWHSVGMSTRSEELLDAVWKSLIGSRCAMPVRSQKI